MEVVERLTLEAAQADTLIACEHRQRYELAARLLSGLAVLDLCCGSGYGSEILAADARQVVGVDSDAATIELAQATVARRHPNVSFQAADAVSYLAGPLGERFEAIVCFEGLEHLRELERALALLRERAERGVRLIASVPNSRALRERNPFHLTDFGYEEALAAFAGFPDTVMLPQYLAEGSLICPAGATDTEVSVTLAERDEPEYANHFIFCVGFDGAEIERAHRGRIQVSSAPLFNRWSEGMKQALDSLRRENARLARARLGQGGAAAASALARIAAQDQRAVALEHRCRAAEARVAELEAQLARGDGSDRAAGRRVRVDSRLLAPELAQPVGEVIQVPPEGLVAAGAPGQDPNSWEARRRRAAEHLIPWIERTLPLSGRTVLEYGCGNGAVSCAFAQRARRVIGLDVDGELVREARRRLRERGVGNVELEHHRPERILDAAAAHRGEVDVFLLYAVLEHLTVAERLAVLALAREAVRPGGAIVVCETPNRLTYFDHHTGQMPFLHLLPDELALDYCRRSPRADFRAAIAAAGASPGARRAALEAIARWGRGVSFHEFELVFEPLERYVIASNYDPLLFGERPVHPEETVLARYLSRHRPDLAPVFSRAWLDLILSPAPVGARGPFLRPWSADTTASALVGATAQEDLLLKGPEACLWVTLPHPSARLVVGVVAGGERMLTLYARPEGAGEALPVSYPPKPRHTAFATFALPRPSGRVALASSRECRVLFVGYED